jgi:hypothetical protein
MILINNSIKKTMTTILNYDTLNENYFYDMANVILNEVFLKINSKKFRIIEIEFYLKCNGHDDPCTHGNPDQMLMHTFYFHKFITTGTYKAGTFKGMDLTFGSKSDKAYFGILIRSIQNMKTEQIIEGPCNVVNKILEEYNCDNIMDFTQGKNLNIFKNKKDFVLVPTDKLEVLDIACGPRIGLNEEKFPHHWNKNYRFVTNKDKIKKGKKSLIYIEV